MISQVFFLLLVFGCIVFAAGRMLPPVKRWFGVEYHPLIRVDLAMMTATTPGTSTSALEFQLFSKQTAGVFKHRTDQQRIEELVAEIEDMHRLSLDESKLLSWLPGTYDCVYASSSKNDSFPEVTSLAALTFNQLLPDDEHVHNVLCHSMLQEVTQQGGYTNAVVFSLDHKEEESGRWVVLTEGHWHQHDSRTMFRRLVVRFKDVCLRRLPHGIHGAHDVFRWVHSTSANSEAILQEHENFLKLVHGSDIQQGSDDAATAAIDSSRALPLRASHVNAAAYSDITYLDEDGLRIQRGAKGGMYVLVRSLPDDDEEDRYDDFE
jgi:hypothetical protein